MAVIGFWLWDGAQASGGPFISDWNSESEEEYMLMRNGDTYTRGIQIIDSTGAPTSLNAGFTITVYVNGVLSVNTASLTAIAGVTGGYRLSYTIAAHTERDRVQFYISGVATTNGGTVALLTPSLQILTVPTSLESADILLNRDMSAVTVTNARSPINALRILRNRVVRSTAAGAGTLDVYREDDATVAWSAVTSVNATAGPIVSSDPA